MKKCFWMLSFGSAAILTGCATSHNMAKAPASSSAQMKAQLADFATLGGASLSNSGLKLVVSGDQLFKPGHSALSQEGVQKVDALAAVLAKHAKDSVAILVYTDNSGTDAKNLKISQRRADHIKKELIKQGISDARVTVTGEGDANPVAANNTDQGRAQNRRAEFDIAASI